MKQKTPSPHSTFKHTATTVKEMDNMGRETKKTWQKLTAYCCAGLLTFQPLISVADTIAVDKTVSVSQRPTLDRAANGVDIVNIARPNDKGVSHNLFSEFNVNKDGLILNNSRTITNTQLGGHIAGNANLTDASARLILNEVTGANRSQLLGYTEIAGQAADYVLANPYGITCDGCGFINIPRVTLAAGKPEMANGQLRSINVDNGNFIVQGMGLNAANVKHLDIIARSAHINAQLHAQKVMMALGKNQVDYATTRPTALENDGSDSPEFALDVAALGGMYVNAITMMGTESGVGVRVAGDMAAATGDMVLTADGNIVINKATAKERVAISSFNGDVTLQGNVHANIIDATAGKTLSLTGDIVAGTSEIDLRARDIVTDAQLLTGFDTNGNYLKDGLLLAIAQNSWINSGEVLSTGDANIVVNRLLNKPDALIQADKDLLLRAVTVTNQNAIIAAGGDLTVTASGYFDNSYGALFSGSQNLTGDFGQFNNTAGLLSAGADIHVAIAQELNNASGNISAGGGVLIEGEGTLTNAGGSINSSDAALNLQGIFNNQNGSYIRDDADLVLNLGGLDNRNGYLFHSGTGVFELNITGDFDNRAGQFGSEGSLFVTADNLFNDDGILYGKDRLDLAITNSITNLRGQLSSGAIMAINSRTLNNNVGEIFAADMAVTITDDFDNRDGLLQAANLQLQAQTLDNQQGDIYTQTLNANATNINNNGGTLEANQLTLTVDGNLSNRIDSEGNAGQLLATGNQENSLSLTVTGELDNTGGLIQSAATNNSLTLANLNNTQGRIQHLSTGRFELFSAAFNNTEGKLIGNGVLAVTADQLTNNSGLISSLDGLFMTAIGTVNNTSGRIE
ncbi:MAG TPA: filamentous hemagglutinin N-terminal domain-containing protein, partial [Cellvibrio sp.]|nr:filamentous hemagglutinin N-terminal domain-containing protein [Cellvibrio sp.]